MGGMGGIWGALIQRGQQWADRGVDWAIWNKQRQQYASQVRHLRRREYQDMVFSMKQAGLNPVLAVGATPGHSGAMTGSGLSTPQSIDVAKAINDTSNAKSAARQAGAAEKGNRIKESGVLSENELRGAQREGIAQQIAQGRAQTALILAQTDLALQESGESQIRRALWKAQSEKYGADAQAVKADIPNIQSGLKYGIKGTLTRGIFDAFGTDGQPGSGKDLDQIGKDFRGSISDYLKNHRSKDFEGAPDVLEQMFNATRSK